VAETITRVTLFIPGVPASAEAWSKGLKRGGLRIDGGALRGDGLDAKVEVDWIENDGTFGQAFSFGTVAPAVISALEAAPGALVLYCQVDLREGREQIVGVVERLRDAGALAVRIEESHLGWDVSRWLELFSSDDAWSWHKGAVVFLSDNGVLQSCGMHAFSLPDAQVRLDGDPAELQELASILNVYQLGEDPVILSGQTFAPDPQTPRRVVERWPDTQYPPQHSCHNPYGVWRLGPPGGSARPMEKLLPVFTPALHALLLALEEEAKGKALTKQQVETIRDRGVCITMEPRDAQKLERARGYSDLDPELVWDQWQIVREQKG
jgi:hypothetical protein